jgi:pyridoxine kinase
MPRILILSSFVAASRVGGSAQGQALLRLGIEPLLVPTVVFGRHPGFGPPGGAVMEPAAFESMLGALEAQGAFAGLDAVITGYFASAQQVAAAAETLVKVRAASPLARLVIDPIMGDETGGLYVREPVAEALADELVPLADIVAPNAWELTRLAGRPVGTVAEAVTAARSLLGKPALVSSVVAGGDSIGVIYADGAGAWLARHARSAAAPKGPGDALAALFTAGVLLKLADVEALRFAVGAVADAVAADPEAADLPFDALPTGIRFSDRVTVEPIAL